MAGEGQRSTRFREGLASDYRLVFFAVFLPDVFFERAAFLGADLLAALPPRLPEKAVSQPSA
jgi:hypothetical protein